MLPPNTPYTPPTQPLNAPPIPQEALTLSRKVDECRPLPFTFASTTTYSWLLLLRAVFRVNVPVTRVVQSSPSHLSLTIRS